MLKLSEDQYDCPITLSLSILYTPSWCIYSNDEHCEISKNEENLYVVNAKKKILELTSVKVVFTWMTIEREILRSGVRTWRWWSHCCYRYLNQRLRSRKYYFSRELSVVRWFLWKRNHDISRSDSFKRRRFFESVGDARPIEKRAEVLTLLAFFAYALVYRPIIYYLKNTWG